MFSRRCRNRHRRSLGSSRSAVVPTADAHGGVDDTDESTVRETRFLRGAALAAGAVAGVPALEALGLLKARGRIHAAKGKGGYGPLVPTPDLRDGVLRMALPEGFQYRSFSPAGATMSDGNLVPLAHDGMAVFNMPDGRFRLVRNHEDRNPPGLGSTAIDTNAYDPLGGAGTTTLVVNPFTRELERDFISLTGTIVNCAGGITPWQSWVTGEETNAGISSGWSRQHGYCFEVPASADTSVPAFPILDMGRFSHEAVAVDPETWIVYETEDNGGNSGFYRFLSHTPGVLLNGGTLQMLAIDGRFNYDTRINQAIGVALPVTWVTIANPNPPGTSSTAVYNQGRALGGAQFARLEGCWYGNGAVYFVATSGGNTLSGQVWEFRPEGDGGTLTLIFESSGPDELDGPDNIAVSPQKRSAAVRGRRRRSVRARADAGRRDLRLRAEPANRTRVGRRHVRGGRPRVECPRHPRQSPAAWRAVGSRHAVRQPAGRHARFQPTRPGRGRPHVCRVGSLGRRGALKLNGAGPTVGPDPTRVARMDDNGLSPAALLTSWRLPRRS